jgi:hypothetical protein
MPIRFQDFRREAAAVCRVQGRARFLRCAGRRGCNATGESYDEILARHGLLAEPAQNSVKAPKQLAQIPKKLTNKALKKQAKREARMARQEQAKQPTVLAERAPSIQQTAAAYMTVLFGAARRAS